MKVEHTFRIPQSPHELFLPTDVRLVLTHDAKRVTIQVDGHSVYELAFDHEGKVHAHRLSGLPESKFKLRTSPYRYGQMHQTGAPDCGLCEKQD
jgi:hypothetical protein